MLKSSAQIRNVFYKAVITTSMLALASPVFSNVLPDERVIHLKGTTNTRDIGGYQDGDLSTVRAGQIIRSDKLSKLSARDFQKLEALGLKTVIDLRTEKENDEAPTVWKGDNPPQFYHFPVGDSKSEWFASQRKMMKKNRFTKEQSLEHMVNGYKTFAVKAKPSYEKMMEVVLDEANWPILIHCSAGKDRSGIAVALILEAIGIEREVIMDEYLLTNKVSRIEEKAVMLSKESKNSSRGNRFSKGTSPEAWLPIVGVDAKMLEAFYMSIDDTYQSMDAYLNELGVDQDARHALAASLTVERQELVMNQ